MVFLSANIVNYYLTYLERRNKLHECYTPENFWKHWKNI